LLASRTSAPPDGFGSCLCFSRLRRMGVSLSAAWCRGVLPQMATDKAFSVESAAAPAPAPSPGSCFASTPDALVQHHALGHPCQAWTSRSETDVAPAPAPYSPMPSCVPNQNTLLALTLTCAMPPAQALLRFFVGGYWPPSLLWACVSAFPPTALAA